MIDVELLGYKINKINMVNDILEMGPLQLTNHMDFTIDHADDIESTEEATATLFSRTECQENDMFFVEIELQAIFRIDITNINEREEANRRCYDELFCYMKEIMTYIIFNTGIEGFRLQKPALIPKCTNSEVDKSADESSSDRIIIFRTDM